MRTDGDGRGRSRVIRLGIAEDQTLVRESLAIVLGLEPDFRVEWTAENGSQALRRLESSPVDVVLTDLRMPELDGVQFIRRGKALGLDCVYIVLTTFHQDEWLVEALVAGAAACFLKEIPPCLLSTAIRQMVAGQFDRETWSPDWRRYAPVVQFQARVDHPQAHGQEILTPRELELLRRLAAGETNAEISSALHLSEGTVKNYVSAIYAKLGVRHRAEAIVVARQRGLA